MQQILAISYYTLLEARRTRLPLLLAAALALMLALAFFVSELAVIESTRLQTSFYAAGARFAAVFMVSAHVLGSITRDYRVCYAWHASGIRNWAELMKFARFNIGAPAAGTSTYINAAVLKNLYGVKVHHVTGYPGSAEERLAIERGDPS